MHPLLAVGIAIVVLVGGFPVIYRIAKHHDLKNQH